MNIVLLIRRTRGYYLDGKVMNYLSERRYMWNLFYKLPYLEFKKRLADIGSLTYLANKFDRIYFWEEYKEVNKEEHIVVPVDEDDWISTSLATELRNFDFQDKPVAQWQVMNLKCSTDLAFHKISWDKTPSCSYAVKTPYKQECIDRNTQMMHYQQDIIKLDKVLSVKVDNFASISFMENRSFNTILEHMKKEYLVENIALLREYEQQVDLYNELLTELYDSCKV